jgi:hypothetical protein
MQQRVIVMLAGICALLFVPGPACGVVVHPGAGDPNLVEWVDRPVDGLVGRWGGSGSCAAISPRHVLTTKHQGGDVGTTVEIGGKLYRVERVWNHPLYVNEGTGEYALVDMRIARLAEANLSEYASLYRGSEEAVNQRKVTVGGWGLGRGEALKTNGITYGYQWADDNVMRLRWCTNQIDLTSDGVSSTNKSSGLDVYHDYIIADFDDPGTTVYEGAVAGYDSGGGWFIKTDAGWELAGITWGAEHADVKQIWFRSASNPIMRHADRMYALRVSSYAEWINSVLDNECQDPPAGDFNSDCRVDIEDAAGFARWWLFDGCSWWDDHCQGRDINSDGRVNMADFAKLSHDFVSGKQ